MSFPGHVFTQLVTHSDDEDRRLPEALGPVRALVTAPVDYPAYPWPKLSRTRQRIAAGMSKAQMARAFGISRQTLYQYLGGAAGTPDKLGHLDTQPPPCA